MTEHVDTSGAPPAPGVGHETRDISTRIVVVFGISLAILAAVVLAAVLGLQTYLDRVQAKAYPRQYPMAHVGPPPEPPAPRLQTKPREELNSLRAEEARHLRSYSWVDASRGVVHVPIDRAAELLLQRGVPARQPGNR